MRGGGYAGIPTYYISKIWKRLKPERQKSYDRKGDVTRIRLRYYLRTAHGKYKHEFAHRLVLEAFVGPCPLGMECCHEDGDDENCYLKNLRWDTRASNTEDKHRHGTVRLGSEVHTAKLTDAKVREILSSSLSTSALAKRYKVTLQNIRFIKKRKTWKHIEVV
jgi:hypothetical protein